MKSRPATDPSYWFLGLQLSAVMWALPTMSLSLVLLVVADTWLGRTFAVCAMLASILPLMATIARSKRSKLWSRGIITLAGVALALSIVVIAHAPTGTTQGRRANQFPVDGFRRYALGNLLPEGDQLLLAFSLVPFIDPLMTLTQSADLKRMTRSLYRELESDSEFRELGSGMQNSYDDLLGVQPQNGNSYVYIPPGVNRAQRCPVLVFFHGSGGNFKAYLWILSKLADQLGYALVAPSSGLGNWRETQSTVCFDTALGAVERIVPIDRERIHLIGLSNGGRALSQLAVARGSQCKSLVFLSPVFDVERIQSHSFSEQNRRRAILVITGSQDDRVPLDYVKENARQMKQSGANVELQTIPEADHFLIFSHRDQWIQMVARWITQPKVSMVGSSRRIGGADTILPLLPQRATLLGASAQYGPRTLRGRDVSPQTSVPTSERADLRRAGLRLHGHNHNLPAIGPFEFRNQQLSANKRKSPESVRSPGEQIFRINVTARTGVHESGHTAHQNRKP